MLARLGGGLRHGMLPGLALRGADACPPANRYPPGSRPGQAFAGNAAVAFSCPRSCGGFKWLFAVGHGFAHRRVGASLGDADILLLDQTAPLRHVAGEYGAQVRAGAAPDLHADASSLLLTSGAASACLMAASILSTIACGVPAGANAPIQVATSYAGTPDSSIVGTSGRRGTRFRVVTASVRSLPDCMPAWAVARSAKITCVSPDITPVTAGAPPRNGMFVISTWAMALNSS